MDVEFDKQFINARAIALFKGGLGIQLDIHDKIVLNEQYKEGIMTHMAKYLAPTLSVETAMIKETIAMNNGVTTCQYLSPVLSACLAQRYVATTANM